MEYRPVDMEEFYGLHLPFPVKPQQKIDGIPDLLASLDIVSEKAARAAIPGFVKVG